MTAAAMMTTAHSMLDDSILSWRDRQRTRQLATLPMLLFRLGRGELVDFPRARPHQFDAWCMFLTQLAAIALHRAARSDSRPSEDEWRAMLLELTGGSMEPWCLVVDDLSRPAFLQPPVPEGTIDGWQACEHPDDIDVLVTTKGHDVKRSLMSSSDIEAWVLSLVTLQTMQGYPGRGYNRISRMKGGYGSRPRVGLAADRTITGRFNRDVQVLLETWDRLIERGFAAKGVALVWLEPWDGRASLTMADLSPHFIELCWRLRCHQSSQGIGCAYTTTAGRRCLPEIENGDTGDAWMPVERDGGALTVGRGGFHYQLLTRLLFEGAFVSAPAQESRPDDQDPMLLLASVMARGQGKTEGLHERVLTLNKSVQRRLGHPDTRAALGKRAGENVQQAKKMRSSVLFSALKRLALGDQAMRDDFDSRVDEIFFEELFRGLDLDDDEAALAWDRRLHEIAWTELQRSIDRCCLPSARWYEGVSAAEAMFRGCLGKHFPTLVASLATVGRQQGG